MRIKTGFVISSLFFLFGCGGGGGDSVSTPPVFVERTSTTCVPNGALQFGAYYPFNNLWGMRYYPTYTDYSACVSGTTTQTGAKYEFTWDWTKSALFPGVKAYQEIKYDFRSMPISNINKLSMTHDFTVDAVGAYNVIYDLWLDKNSVYSAPQSIEITIWVGRAPEWIPDQTIDTISIDGVIYNLVHNALQTYPDGSLIGHKLYQFHTVQPMPKGTIQVKPFTDYLVAKGLLPSDYLLNRIEFGSEQMTGKGKLTINNYSVNNN